ncbi:MAG: hypothetical protein E7Z89_05155 [Cyanobacteria bacterium SIG28]|nr:hypothetical protein [Cyanobacteria bacterium SIG28]
MLKKLYSRIFLLFLLLMIFLPAHAGYDKTSEDYLKNRRHITPITPAVENFAQTVVKSALKKETGRNFKVKLSAYTLSSMRKGIFKSLDVYGNDVEIKGINLSFVHVYTLSDYNWIDYKQNPPVFKSDINCAYEIGLSQDAINEALLAPKYQKEIEKINQQVYPLFCIKKVQTELTDDRIKVIIFYNYPLSPRENDRRFSVSTNLAIQNGEIISTKVYLDRKYRNLSSQSVLNLINLLKPLEYTLDFLNPGNCNFNIENVNIINNIIQIGGKILIKGE